MKRAYYCSSIADFLTDGADAILGQLAQQSEFAVEPSQRDAWLSQIGSLKETLHGHHGGNLLRVRNSSDGKTR